MKLTEQHVSDEWLNKFMCAVEIGGFSVVIGHTDKIMACLLELKQRRAEDRQREENGKL